MSFSSGIATVKGIVLSRVQSRRGRMQTRYRPVNCQTRFWTPNPPDPPVFWKTRLKFDWTVDAFTLLAITNWWRQPGAVLRWGTCPSPRFKVSWPFWRDFCGPKMLQNPNSLQRSPDPLADGKKARFPLLRTPPRCRSFGRGGSSPKIIGVHSPPQLLHHGVSFSPFSET